MSRFYASIQGNRSAATRQGTAASGIAGHIRGWDIGVKVEGHDYDGEDVFLGRVRSVAGRPTFIPT